MASFFSPHGLPFEISSDVVRRTARTLAQREGVPEKISHIGLHSPDHMKLADWFCGVLGFKLSDWLGDFMCFLRCNTAHHRIAILPRPPCLNHVAYDMLSVNDMMVGINRLKQSGTGILWAPGRQTAGNNTFRYFTTSAGFAVEYTADLEDVVFESHMPKVYVLGPRVLDKWGIGVGGAQTMPHPEPDKGLFWAVQA